GPHFTRKIKPIIVDVCDDHIARAYVACNGCGHGADGSCAGNEHIFAHQIEGQGSMRGIAEGVKNSGEFVGNIVRYLERIECRNGQVVGKSAWPVDPDSGCVSTQVPPAGAAITAEAASDVSFARYPVADGEALNLLPDLHDFAHVFMADMHGNRYGLACPVVPFPDVDVGTADRRFAYLYQDIVMPDDR